MDRGAVNGPSTPAHHPETTELSRVGVNNLVDKLGQVL
jgi:hypothetical protein